MAKLKAEYNGCGEARWLKIEVAKGNLVATQLGSNGGFEVCFFGVTTGDVIALVSSLIGEKACPTCGQPMPKKDC
jgi:hypothetical protein